MINMPRHTKIMAISVYQLKSWSLSERIIAEKTAPKSGLVIVKTATLETGLYFNKKPCRVNAHAYKNARYKSINAAPTEIYGMSPPKL